MLISELNALYFSFTLARLAAVKESLKITHDANSHSISVSTVLLRLRFSDLFLLDLCWFDFLSFISPL